MRITMVSAPGCHLCADARDALKALAREFLLDVREVGASSPEGLALVAKYRPALQPLVLLEDEFFSAGRLPRRKLRRRLERRVA